MTETLGLLLISFVVTLFGAVPFINLLYRLKFQRANETYFLKTMNKIHAWKVGTPNSGGILVILVTVILGVLFIQPAIDFRHSPSLIIFMALVLYGLLGLYDDIKKFFGYQKERFWGLRLRYKLILQILLALLLAWLIFLHLNVSGVVPLHIPLLGRLDMDVFSYVAFATLTIVATVNAFNITDGLDGLASGLLVMTLVALLVIATSVGGESIFYSTNYPSQIQTIIGIWIGAMLAFLYFNIHPARVWMGDSGALGFGGGMAVISLLLGTPLLLIIFGGIYVLETLSSLLQWYSIKFLPKKIFLIAPIHHHFEALGWPETKVTMRFWLAGAILTIVGLLIFQYARYGL